MIIQNGPFYPTTLLGWLAVGGYGVAIGAASFGFMWKLLKKPLEERIETESRDRQTADANRDEEVRRLIQIQQKNEGKLDLLDRGWERIASDLARTLEETKELQGKASAMFAAIQVNELAHVNVLGKISERLARMEERLDIRAHEGD